jgi:hypothetical protein
MGMSGIKEMFVVKERENVKKIARDVEFLHTYQKKQRYMCKVGHIESQETSVT